MCQHRTNQRRMYQEAATNKKAYKPYCFACIFLFLSCIPIKKYGVVSLGMGFDRLTACSWCRAKWVKQSSLKHLTLRTAFLVFFAFGSRCSEMHALNGLPNDAAFEPDASMSLCFLPHCLAKSQLPGFPSPVISVRSLSSSLAPDDEDRLISPMRALQAYRKPTEALCSKWRRLLLYWNENYRYHIGQSTVSRWLLEVTTAAYARPGSELFCLLPKAS